jgi:hypothetical protein
MPLVVSICSSTTSAVQLVVTARRSPVKKLGSAPGRATRRTNPSRVRPTVRASSA